MTRLLLTSNDDRAFDELRELLGEHVELVPPEGVHIEWPDEEGTTFSQNAMHIADTAARASGFVTIAESVGIVVDALDGGPGFAHLDDRLRSFESTLDGVIATEARGVERVGDEPIFELDDGMPIAELLPEARDDANSRLTALAG